MALQKKMYCPVVNINGEESFVFTGMRDTRADARFWINIKKKESPGLFDKVRVAEVLIGQATVIHRATSALGCEFSEPK